MSDTFTFLQYPQRSILMYAEGYSRTQNMPFNTTRKTIYKGVDSTLGFDIKNQDRKPVNLLDKTIVVNIMQVRTGELIVQRRATLVEPESGFCEFTVFSSDTVDLDPGLYQLSATVYDSDGMAKSLYTDHNRRATMEIELCDGAYPKYVPSVECVFTKVGDAWVSQPIPGNLQKNGGNFNTIQIKVSGFTGTLEAHVSLEYGSDGMFYPVKFIDDSKLLQFDNTTAIQGWNFVSNARWVKFIYTPSLTNTGTVDKVLYRS